MFYLNNLRIIFVHFFNINEVLGLLMITSRAILNNIKELGIYLDSESLEPLLDKKDNSIIRILRYSDLKCLNFFRIPFKTNHDELKNIIECNWRYDGNTDSYIVDITKTDKIDISLLGYTRKSILDSAKRHYEKQYITEIEFNKILSIFAQANFNRTSPHIYITADDFILKKRFWFESNFPGLTLNIMTIDEAIIFLDLFFKNNNLFFMDRHFRLNEGLWYLNSMNSKLSHYKFDKENFIINSLADRYIYALMALDKMGIQYFLGVNNDTEDNTLYHFYFFITLLTGIFDNLALIIDKKLDIKFHPKDRISMKKNKRSKEFWRLVKIKDPKIDNYRQDYVNFINLILSFRDSIIHREGLSKMGFEYRGEIHWEANFIEIPTDEISNIKNYIKSKPCEDQDDKYSPYTKWGTFFINDAYYIIPYIFSINAMRKLTEFINKYMELLGYSSFKDSQKLENDSFTRDLNIFEKYHLGF